MIKSKIKHNIKGYIDLIRPFTLLAPIIVSISIMMASCVYNGTVDELLNILWIIVIPASFSLAILNAASNTLNQITDQKGDKISKPYRPIPRGLVSIKDAKIISILLYVTAFLLALLVNIVFVAFILLITVFTITYSIPPRFKDMFIINQLWVGIPRGFLAILASWSVFGNPLVPLPLTIGIIAMSYLIGGSITKDITDSDADKKTGTRTLINTYGVKKAAFMALPFMLFPFIFIPILIDIGIIESYFGLLTFFIIPVFLIFYLIVKDNTKVKRLENTSSWALMYITYFVFAFGFSVLTIAGTAIS